VGPASREGDAERALAAYQTRGRLHLEETRGEAGERMVNDWAEAASSTRRSAW
jgi:hypothetical protein